MYLFGVSTVFNLFSVLYIICHQVQMLFWLTNIINYTSYVSYATGRPEPTPGFGFFFEITKK